MALPTNLPLLGTTLYGNPLLPQAKNTIDLQKLDFVQFGIPFVANNIATGGSVDKFLKVGTASWSLLSKVGTVNKSTIAKVAGVSDT